MPSTYSPLLRFEEIGSGEQAGLWGDTTNKNLGELVEQAIAGVTTVSLSGTADVTLSALDGALDQSRSAVLKFIGSPSGPINIIIPTSQKLYVVRNESGQIIRVKTLAQPQIDAVVLKDDEASLVFCDGSVALRGIQTEGVGTLTVPGGGTGVTTFTGGFIKSPGGTGNLFGAALVNLTAEVSGQLPTANGGTGVSATNYCNLTTNVNGILPVVSGGTGASNIATARTNLGLGTLSVIDTNGSTTQFLRGDGTFAVPPTNPGTVTSITATGGIETSTGLPITSSGTISLTNTGVTAAAYTNANITVDAKGRIIAAVSGNTGVTSLSSGAGISVSGSTGPVTITNTGVTSISAGSGIAVSGSTGAVTISSTGTAGVTTFNGRVGAVTLTASDVTTALGATAVQNAGFATSAGTAGSCLGNSATATNPAGGGSFITSSNISSQTVSAAGTATNVSGGGTVSATTGTFSGNVRSVTNVAAGATDASAIGISTGGGGSAINWWSTITGNSVTSMFFSATGAGVGAQSYSFSYSASGAATVAYQFYGDGTANKTGGGSWGSISDARLKENIQPLTGALNKITALNPVSYDWKITAPNEPTVGFISQEVAQVIPNAVVSHDSTEEEKQYTDGETLSVSWQADFNAYLVGAIKELKALVDAQAAEIAALKAQ